MISSLEVNFDLLQDMLGIVVEKKDIAPKEGETLKLHVPILMPYISRSIPVKDKKIINKGNKLFLNDSSCRPTSRILLTTQNYLTGVLEKNHEWVDQSSMEIKKRVVQNSDGYEYIVKGYDSEGNAINVDLYEEYKVYHINGGEKVTCYAPFGKLSKLLFENNEYD